MTIGERVSELRKARKLSQRYVAMQTNLTHSTIGRIERGEVIPEGKTLDALASFFGTTIDFLLYGEENLNKKPVYSNEFQFALYEKTKEFTEEQKMDILNIIDILNKKGK